MAASDFYDVSEVGGRGGRVVGRSRVVVVIRLALLTEFYPNSHPLSRHLRTGSPRRVQVVDVELVDLLKTRLHTGVQGDIVSQVCGSHRGDASFSISSVAPRS